MVSVQSVVLISVLCGHGAGFEFDSPFWYYYRIFMPTVMTVKLDPEQARRVANLAKKSGVTKSEVVRRLIDEAGLIESGDDLAAWVKGSEGRGFGIRHRG